MTLEQKDTCPEKLLLAIGQNLREQIEMVSRDDLENFESSCREQLALLEMARNLPQPATGRQEALVAEIGRLRTTLSLMLADSKRQLGQQLQRIGKGKTGLAGYQP